MPCTCMPGRTGRGVWKTCSYYSCETSLSALNASGHLLLACPQLATANSAILRLTKELAWAEEVLRAMDGLRAGARGFHDRVFNNEMDVAVAAARQVCLLRNSGRKF